MLRSWRAVLLLTVFLKLLGFGIVLPLLPYYGRELGAGGFAIGALFAAYSLTQFALAPLWGALADRYGRRPVLLASIAWGFLAYLLFALAGTYTQLFASRVLAGLSAAVIGVSQAYLADRTAPEERARGMGMLGAAFGMGFVVGPALGAILSRTRWGFALPGLVAAALSAANFALALRWLPESRAPADSLAGKGMPLWRRRSASDATAAPARLRAVLGVLFLTTAAFAMLYPVFPLFLDERFGFGPLQAGLLFSGLGVAAAIVQAGALGKLVARWGERPLLGSGALVMAGGFAALPFCATVGGLALALPPLALGFALTTPLAQTLVSRLSSPADQGRNLGAAHSMSSLARAVGPLAGGFLYEATGTSTPFWAGALLLLAGALLTFRVPAPCAENGRQGPAGAAGVPPAHREDPRLSVASPAER
ncbi:MAG: MFS transporter [Gemmatimonadetes bacterium]|nr:MFS transporter [Gemmatimonadota bacterium]